MNNRELFDTVKKDEASFSEGGGITNGGDGGSQKETPSVCPSDSQLPQGGSLHSTESDSTSWLVDLTREEYVAFRYLQAKVNGPLRLRFLWVVLTLLFSVTALAMALEEWYAAGFAGYPDPMLLVLAVLALFPLFYVCLYLPHRVKKTAAAQYDRSVSSGMSFTGRLTVGEDYVEKAGPSATARIPMDERTLFIENSEMMVFINAASPALVLPARCLTEEMAAAVRGAADRMPVRNRKFIARVVTQGHPVTEMPAVSAPEEMWVSTYTYTVEEYTTLTRGMIIAHYWRMAPVNAIYAAVLAVMTGWDMTAFTNETLMSCSVNFLLFFGLMTVFNLLLPLSRSKRQAAMLTAHDLTMQVRFDTLALRIKGQKTPESYVLWCDVDHVYDKGDFVEIIHNKRGNLHIPKRAIEDIAAFEAALNRCRGK